MHDTYFSTHCEYNCALVHIDRSRGTRSELGLLLGLSGHLAGLHGSSPSLLKMLLPILQCWLLSHNSSRGDNLTRMPPGPLLFLSQVNASSHDRRSIGDLLPGNQSFLFDRTARVNLLPLGSARAPNTYDEASRVRGGARRWLTGRAKQRARRTVCNDSCRR